MELGAPGLHTATLRLEPLNESHRAALSRSNAVEHMWSSMPVISTGTNIDAYFDHSLKMATLGTGQVMAAIRQEDDRLIGLSAFLNPNRMNRRTRIGYNWVEPALRGSAVVEHIHYLMLKRAYQWRARRVAWWLSLKNERAIAAVEKIGAKREGVLRQHTRFADGSWADLVVLSLVSDEIRDSMAMLGEQIEKRDADSDT
ncbi:N-acetyltransferase [Henriciella barbarensis]|uniref:N-acetyltransferase n=1 Tax=Henriciella barbarensis TaxID=86342 RepID=A0A399R3K1_9PROT|nr:GNAT family protein [Henriciella barbarensis]RIJ24437.1 N-acetyltransferase [Henriciella barbarensis]